MAEGFLKLENDLEGEADKCLQELVDRCLVLVSKKSLDGTKIRSCKVHDLIYDLCVREIQRENIFIMNDIVLGVAECGNLSMQKMQPFKHVTGDKIECRLYRLYRALLTPIHCQLRDHDNNDLLERTRSIFSFHHKYSYFIVKSELIHFKLLRVLELRNIDMDHFPVQILVEVIMGILNVKEIGIFGNEIRSNGLLNSLVHLQQLQTLSLIYCSSRFFPASAKTFPATLKKLKLKRNFLRWSYMDIIAELPNLEVLKVMFHAYSGDEWIPNVTGFTRLKVLLIEDCFLMYWKATDDNFPVLEHLVLKKCTYLKEIPIEFAEIHTLQLIELTSCLPELGEPAARIQQEQEDLGNNPVDVRISDDTLRRPA
ncbi:putative late blight resistance protein R1B-19 [Capsicum chacoense]